MEYNYSSVMGALQRHYDTYKDIELELYQGCDLSDDNKFAGAVATRSPRTDIIKPKKKYGDLKMNKDLLLSPFINNN